MSNGKLTTIVAAGAAILLACLGGTTALFTQAHPAQACIAETLPGPSTDTQPPPARWDDEQMGNATTIVAVGKRLNVPPRGWVIALATAMQESSLRNLPGGDRDSVGLFQQRPSQGWGTVEQLRNPEYAAEAFYQGLLEVPDWWQLPLAEAAQAVQRSAFPDAYTQWEADAHRLAAAITGTTPQGLTICGGGGWVRPVDGPITSGFGPRGDSHHNGIDIAAPRGTTIHAAGDGTVLRVRCDATLHGQPYTCDLDGGIRAERFTGCGWYIDIKHAGGITTRYCHLLARPELNPADAVTAGQPIGQVGTSGSSSGPHLHFEVHVSGHGAIDPALVLPIMTADGEREAGASSTDQRVRGSNPFARTRSYGA